MADRAINRAYCTRKLRADYAHVGLYDATAHELWIARNRWGMPASRVSHARLLQGGTQDTSTAEKDRFVCYWYHTPGSGEGMVHGYPIDWTEGHLLIRLDPNWSYLTKTFIPSTDARRIEKNIEQQYQWAETIFKSYCALRPRFALCWHMIGPRAVDSMFYIERVEGR